MKINYNPTRLKSNLNFGLAFLLFGLVTFIVEYIVSDYNSMSNHSISASLVIGGFISILYYYYDNSVQFLSIKNGVIKQHGLFGPRVKLKEIIELKEFAGDYFLKTKRKTMIIDTSIIDAESKKKLKEVLNELGLEWLRPRNL